MSNRDYLYLSGIAKGYFSTNYLVDDKLGFQTIPHGIIVPHVKTGQSHDGYWGTCGVLDSQGKFHKEITTMQVPETFDLPKEQIKQNPATVIYLGLFAPAWGHDLTINLKRLWFLNSKAFRADFKDCPIVYTPWHKKGWGEDYQTLEQKPNFPRLLEILGIDPNALQPIEQPTQFENVIVPDASIYFLANKGLRFTKKYRATIDRIRDFALKNRTPIPDKKIYYFYGRHQIGEDRIALYFMSKGYTPLLPERMALDEQLNYLVNCESFASTLGSCSHNSLFLREGTEAIFIPRAPFLFTSYQELLNQVNSLNAHYVDSSLSVFGELHESYCFIISEQLKRFFGDKFGGYDENDFKVFLTYVRQAVSCNFKFNKKALKYYEPIYEDFLAQLKRREDLLKAYNVNLV